MKLPSKAVLVAIAIAGGAAAVAILHYGDRDRARDAEWTPDEKAPPAMPTGMLVPHEAWDAAAEPLDERLRASPTKKDGWFEITSASATDAGARPSLWLSVTAFAEMEPAFQRAQAGFGPFGTRTVEAAHVPALVGELARLAPDAGAVYARTVDDVAALARAVAAKHEALVVVTP